MDCVSSYISETESCLFKDSFVIERVVLHFSISDLNILYITCEYNPFLLVFIINASLDP